MKKPAFLHIVRNPFGWSHKARKEASLTLADEYEKALHVLEEFYVLSTQDVKYFDYQRLLKAQQDAMRIFGKKTGEPSHEGPPVEGRST